jgi:signal transduction histidine kinase
LTAISAAEGSFWPSGSVDAGAELEALRRRLLRLAFDVHDGPMQHLVAVGFRARELQRELASAAPIDPEAISSQIGEVINDLSSVESVLRGLITTLENARPKIDTLSEIVAVELALFRRWGAAKVIVDIPADFQPDSHSQALALAAIDAAPTALGYGLQRAPHLAAISCTTRATVAFCPEGTAAVGA